MKKEKSKGELNGKGTGKKEKKAYDLPGQKHDPPEKVWVSGSMCSLQFWYSDVIGQSILFYFLIVSIRFILQRDPSRIFYKSLYEQVPGSEMAAIW